MFINFDANSVKPWQPSQKRKKPFKKYDYWNLEGETFGLLYVLPYKTTLDTPDGPIPFYPCLCNCQAQFSFDEWTTYNGYPAKMAMPAHLFNAANSDFKKGVWCCDECKKFYKSGTGSHILQQAVWRMEMARERGEALTLVDALRDAETQFEVEETLGAVGAVADNTAYPYWEQKFGTANVAVHVT